MWLGVRGAGMGVAYVTEVGAQSWGGGGIIHDGDLSHFFQPQKQPNPLVI